MLVKYVTLCYKKAKVKVKRMGLKSYKALFSIRVLKVTLPWEPSFADDPNVSVSFERGGTSFI